MEQLFLRALGKEKKELDDFECMCVILIVIIDVMMRLMLVLFLMVICKILIEWLFH